MSRKYSTLAIFLTLLISGCSEDINSVKSSRLYFNDAYTIDEAFSNRKICKSVKWETVTDPRGRNLVQYKCELRGAKTYYEDLSTRKLEDLKKQLNSEPTITEQKLDYAQKHIDPVEQNLLDQRSKQPNPLESIDLIRLNALKKILNPESPNDLLQLSSYAEYLEDRTLVDIARSFEEQDRWLRLNSQYSQVTPERMYRYNETKSKLSQSITLALAKTNSLISEEESRLVEGPMSST